MKKTMCWLLCVLLILPCVQTVSAQTLHSDNLYELQLGTAAYALEPACEYTLFLWMPDQVGVYTLTCDDALVGIVSYIDLWVQQMPSADNVNAHEVRWECTAVGQSVIVAARAQESAVEMTLRCTPSEYAEPTWVTYRNHTAPRVFTINSGRVLYAVDTLDAVADEAVLGADGYYHLNAANGPVLLANLHDSVVSLAEVCAVGQLKGVETDENGNVVKWYDYSAALEQYAAYVDTDTWLYPLTDDLIAMFRGVGTAKGWYGEHGYIGGEEADAWMFACYYLPQLRHTIGDLNADGVVGVQDAATLFYYINGAKALDADTLELADVSGDGVVNFADASRLFYMVSGRI